MYTEGYKYIHNWTNKLRIHEYQTLMIQSLTSYTISQTTYTIYQTHYCDFCLSYKLYSIHSNYYSIFIFLSISFIIIRLANQDCFLFLLFSSKWVSRGNTGLRYSFKREWTNVIISRKKWRKRRSRKEIIKVSLNYL